MQLLGQRGTNAPFDTADLVEQQLVVNDNFYLRERKDLRMHVLHARSHCHHLLRHTVAHSHPLEVELLLREHGVLILVRHFRLLDVERLLLAMLQRCESDAEIAQLDAGLCTLG